MSRSTGFALVLLGVWLLVASLGGGLALRLVRFATPAAGTGGGFTSPPGSGSGSGGGGGGVW